MTLNGVGKVQCVHYSSLYLAVQARTSEEYESLQNSNKNSDQLGSYH